MKKRHLAAICLLAIALTACGSAGTESANSPADAAQTTEAVPAAGDSLQDPTGSAPEQGAAGSEGAKEGEEESDMNTNEIEQAQKAFQEVEPGKSFKNLLSHNPCITQRFCADPGVMVYGGRVYVYATNDGDALPQRKEKNDYGKIRSINMMSSSDLVNWEDHGSIPVAGKDGIASWAGNSWAPCACHKQIGGKEQFFLYFANSGNGIGVLRADSPTGPWEDPLGEAIVPRNTPGIEGVPWLFDPAVLADEDGNGYLYFGGGVPEGREADPGSFRVVKLTDDMLHLDGVPAVIDVPWGFEDSCINRIGDTYYYSYCTNWSGENPLGIARIGYMTSDSPMGPFTYQGTCFNNPGDFFGTTGNNHHTIISFEGEQYIFYHAEMLNREMYGEMLGYRTTHVDKLPMADGLFGNARGTTEGVKQLSNVDAFAEQSASSFAWQAGVEISGLGKTQALLGAGDWIGVSGVDFASGAKKVKLCAQSAEGAWIRVTKGTVNGEVLAFLRVPASDELQEISAEVSGAEGVCNLYFAAAGDVVLKTWCFE